MRKQHLTSKLILIMGALLASVFAQAGIPLWTFERLTATNITVPANDTATVQYRITNQSQKPHILEMKPIQGITQITTPDNCPNPFKLNYQESCILNLSISGQAINGEVVGGPVVCQSGNSNQCYQPSPADSLNITKGPNVYYTVSGYVDHLEGTLVLVNNGDDALTLNAGADNTFTFSKALPPGSPYSVTIQTQPINQACTVTNGNGTITNKNITNVVVTCVTFPTTLEASLTDLALSVTGLQEYGINGTDCSGNPGTQCSGVSRIITITNTGTAIAEKVTVTMPTWPTGTTSTTTCSDSLLPNQACTITVNPGATSTLDSAKNPCGSGTAPQPNVVNVMAENSNSVSTNVVILDYACIYQGGYIFAFNDTPSITQSVGGKVTTKEDQASNGIFWSSNGNSSAYSLDRLPGIDQLSTSTSSSPTFDEFEIYYENHYLNYKTYSFSSSKFKSCDGKVDGSCNVYNIFKYYDTVITNYEYRSTSNELNNGPTNRSYYAAGLCSSLSIDNYKDWYLPAVCELGYYTPSSKTSADAGCLNSGSPTIAQNITSNVFNKQINAFALDGEYWSSTQQGPPGSYHEFDGAWYQKFSSNNNNYTSQQGHNSKATGLHVLCVREFNLAS